MAFLLLFLASFSVKEACADDDLGRLNIMEENDYFASDDDRHYTQGLRVSYTTGAVSEDGFWDQPFGLFEDHSFIFNGDDRKRKYEWTILGQSIFTPTNLMRTTPILKDRPYAAWLYTGASLLQDILTYAETGGMVRFGQNLGADYGPNRIRPSLSGTGWFDGDQLKDGKLGWYIFAGTQGRAVERNIFLDGNSFEASPSVDKKNLVADFMGGASLLWSEAARVDFTVTQRTKEFYGQQGHPDRFGGINLVLGF